MRVNQNSTINIFNVAEKRKRSNTNSIIKKQIRPTIKIKDCQSVNFGQVISFAGKKLNQCQYAAPLFVNIENALPFQHEYAGIR